MIVYGVILNGECVKKKKITQKDQIAKLESRVAALEQYIRMLDSRTSGSIVLGPGSGYKADECARGIKLMKSLDASFNDI